MLAMVRTSFFSAAKVHHSENLLVDFDLPEVETSGARELPH
jgi:hypothetical protein